MSASTLYEQGLKALEKKDYAAALTSLESALKASAAANPNPDWLLALTKAEMGIHAYEDALADAELAYHSALGRQSDKTARWLVQAQYRRAVALGALKRYADADACAVWSLQLVEGKRPKAGEEDEVLANVDAEGRYRATPADLPKTMTNSPGQNAAGEEGGTGKTLASVLGQANTNDSTKADWTQAYMWRGVVLRELQKLPMADPGRKITVTRVPPKPVAREKRKAQTAKPVDTAKKAEDEKDTKTATPPTTVTAAPATTAPSAPKPTKLRVDMYQTSTTVNLTLYAKGVDSSSLDVKATSDKAVRLSGLPANVAGPSQTVTLSLAGTISTSEPVDVRVTPYKIELKVVKEVAGTKWGTWGEQVDGEQADAEPKATEKAEKSAEKSTSTADRIVPVMIKKDENKAEATATLPSKTATSASTKTAPSGPAYPTSSKSGPKNWDAVARENDADDDDKADSNIDDFFKKLYAGSDPEQQRAMQKSFIESNGTSLSTDWSTVGKGKVEVVPPEGVEPKKWES